MSMDTVIDLGKACGRELSEAEAARLREAGSRLNRALAVAGRDGISTHLL